MSTGIPELKQKRKKAEKKKKLQQNIQALWTATDNHRRFNKGIMGIPEEQKETKEIFGAIKTENVLKLVLDSKPQIKEAQRT